MAQQQAIKLKIAGKSYSFTLKHEANEEQSLAEKEELYRLAEREVNAYVTRFEKAKYEGFSTQDCLAMAALQLAISSVSLARSRDANCLGIFTSFAKSALVNSSANSSGRS